MGVNKDSKYQPLWELIRKDHTAKIIASPRLHKRIIKAVTKRKDLDLTYKFMCGESHKKAILSTHIEGNTVTFTLHFQPYYNSIGAY